MSLFGNFARSALFRFEPETAHNLSIGALSLGIVPVCRRIRDPRLVCKLAGLSFANPVGLAAGYDKNGVAPNAILSLGFGFCEIGTVTPRSQAGNPRPRIFRLEKFDAVINRLGFNNDGHDAVFNRLQRRLARRGITGVNIGANKDSEDFIGDYELGIERFWPVADYFTANISSPNTPGLRDLQAGEALRQLLERVLDKRDAMAEKTGIARPVFLKIAPDLDRKQMEDIAGVISPSALDGLIVSNTTISRSGVDSDRQQSEAGGLSGKPLFERSTIILARMRQLLGEKMPIIGVGGIDSVETAWSKLEAGANLLQLYTGMIYQGPCIASQINKGLLQRLRAGKIDHIQKICGRATNDWAKRKLPEEQA
ncbi:MAG: quinone-dependent dihydroorotate dehydrogenase [Rhizobiaceae bacterium]